MFGGRSGKSMGAPVPSVTPPYAKGRSMLTYDDCVAMSGFTSEEVEAIAEHEHVPSIVALEMGCYLLERDNGTAVVQRIIQEDINVARSRGDTVHAAELRLTLNGFRKRCSSHAA
jgi:hypothetical protein